MSSINKTLEEGTGASEARVIGNRGGPVSLTTCRASAHVAPRQSVGNLWVNVLTILARSS